MPRINSLTLLVIVHCFAVFGHGENEPKLHSATAKMKRRRKTPLELVQIADSGVRERKKETRAQAENLIELNAFDIDTEENDRKSKLIPNINKEQSSLISLQSENRGIIGPKKDPAGEHSYMEGTNNSDNENETREYPVVQKINEMVKKRQKEEIVEADAIMKMLLISNGGSMDMSMPADAPSDTLERSVINSDQLPAPFEGSRSSITLSKPPSDVEVTTDEGGPISSQPDSAGGVPDVNGDPSTPNSLRGEEANGDLASADETNSPNNGSGSSSSASFPTLITVSIVSLMMGFL